MKKQTASARADGLRPFSNRIAMGGGRSCVGKTARFLSILTTGAGHPSRRPYFLGADHASVTALAMM
jgi:hypothetical protein